MNTIIGGFIGLLVIVTIVILGPTLAGSIQAAQPALGATSDWNETHNTNMPNGASLWAQDVAIGGIVILVFFVALAIWSDFGIGARFKCLTSSMLTWTLRTCDRMITSMYPFEGSATGIQNPVVMLG
jgi:hypothetical protein